MLMPIGDDNRDRRLKPIINYLFILINVLVFVFLQDLGNNQVFTYTYSAVPEEILSGEDVVSDDRVVSDPVSGDTFRIPGL
ncbi:MAG: rhomboid family intramembrane serine protease, partial [Ignavibacteria bacterium]